ncbi:helix-turn-helix domain-containing protein [Streptomyces sp. NPDC058301]|uniref:helix-turn-helix domain-containing protein n=1 Tax=Streptomyces sp. NPDC058301 TaxID=3346436 RepID=UPI0036E28EB3
MSERVDALIARSAALPPPQVRARLRQAGCLTQAEVAEALGVHRIQVVRWEKGRAEPRQPHRRLYVRLLQGLAEKFPEVTGEQRPRPGVDGRADGQASPQAGAVDGPAGAVTPAPEPP